MNHHPFEVLTRCHGRRRPVRAEVEGQRYVMAEARLLAAIRILPTAGNLDAELRIVV